MSEIMIGPIVEHDGDRLRVGATSIVFLAPGTACDLPLGTLVRVTFAQRHGRREAESIQPLPDVR